jgi:BCCT family betaine/carnitine transporter
MYWSAIEWASYYQAPPFGIAPETLETARWASSSGIFHWCVIARAFYCLPIISIVYPFYSQHVHSIWSGWKIGFLPTYL